MVRKAAGRLGMRPAGGRVRRRGFEAAKLDRLNAQWKPSTASIDSLLGSEGERIRQRSRDLYLNNPYAKRAIEAIVNNVVGTGIVPVPKLDDATANEKLRERWKYFAEEVDLTGRLDMAELQQQALREEAVSGDALIHFAMIPQQADPIRTVPLALEMIEAERLANDSLFGYASRNTDNGNEIRNGVEVDGMGRPVAYWLLSQHPNDLNAYWTRPERHEARDYIHLYRQLHTGQTRGYSWLTAVVHWLHSLGYYVDNELNASAVASCFTAVVKSDGGDDLGLATPSGEDSVDDDGNRFERLQPGLVAHLSPGEDIEVINPMRPNATAEVFVNLIVRNIALGADLSFERLSRDYSKTNFHGNRAGDLEDRRGFRILQRHLIHHLCKPVWRQFILSGSTAGRDGFPSISELVANPDPWLRRVDWIAPGWEWTDPETEARAAEIEIGLGLTSRQDLIAKRGGDHTETFAKLKQEEDLAEVLDINIQGKAGLEQEMPSGGTQGQTASAQ